MTLTYSGADGGTYSGGDGGTWGDHEPTYRLDGDPVPGLVSERRTFTTTELTFEVDATRYETLTQYRDTADKYERLSDTDGGFRTVDRAATDGRVTVTPPGRRQPPREEHTAFVGSFSATPRTQRQDAYRVALTFIDARDRTQTATATPTRGSNEWRVALSTGDIVTRRVQYNPEATISTAADTTTLVLILTAAETQLLEQAAAQQDAVSVREVPDGTNTYDDNSSGNRNTVTVTPPDAATELPSGAKVIADWTVALRARDAYRVTLTLGEPT